VLLTDPSAEKIPGGLVSHLRHTVQVPAILENFPVSQLKHCSALLTFENFPAGHEKHTSSISPDWFTTAETKVPARQVTHSVNTFVIAGPEFDISTKTKDTLAIYCPPS
jgi:hypothetical protein